MLSRKGPCTSTERAPYARVKTERGLNRIAKINASFAPQCTPIHTPLTLRPCTALAYQRQTPHTPPRFFAPNYPPEKTRRAIYRAQGTGVLSYAKPAVITDTVYFCFLSKPAGDRRRPYNLTYKKIEIVEHILRSSGRTPFGSSMLPDVSSDSSSDEMPEIMSSALVTMYTNGVTPLSPYTMGESMSAVGACARTSAALATTAIRPESEPSP